MLRTGRWEGGAHQKTGLDQDQLTYLGSGRCSSSHRRQRTRQNKELTETQINFCKSKAILRVWFCSSSGHTSSATNCVSELTVGGQSINWENQSDLASAGLWRILLEKFDKKVGRVFTTDKLHLAPAGCNRFQNWKKIRYSLGDQLGGPSHPLQMVFQRSKNEAKVGQQPTISVFYRSCSKWRAKEQLRLFKSCVHSQRWNCTDCICLGSPYRHAPVRIRVETQNISRDIVKVIAEPNAVSLS